MSTTIKTASFENFMSFSKITCDFDENLNYLIGKNGSAKSTLGLTGIWFVMQGIAEKSSKDSMPIIGERKRFIGKEGPTAKGSIVFHDNVLNCDIIAKRKMTKDGTSITFEGPEGMTLDQNWLNSLFDSFMIAPSTFEKLSSKEQAIALGLDVSSYDQIIKDLKNEYTLTNRELSKIGTPEKVDKVNKVDVIQINTELKAAREFNTLQGELEIPIAELRNEIIGNRKKISDNEEAILILQKEIKDLQEEEPKIIAKAKALSQPDKLKDTEVLETKLTEASTTNEKAVLWDQYQKELSQIDKLKKELDDNKKKQSEQDIVRTEYIKKMKLPFSNLTIDEEGNLLLEGRPIKDPFYSTGERIKIILSLAASRNPELRYAYVQDFNLLDNANQKSIIDFAKESNIQLVIEYIGESKTGFTNAILLQDSEIIE